MLKFDTTHEYYMHNVGMYYSVDHEGLCLYDRDMEDSVRVTGVTEANIIQFVSGLFKHNAQLAASLKKEIGLQDIETPTVTPKQRKTKSPIAAA